MAYAVGSLVRARGREWVVLPNSTDDMLVLRPLGGMERETAGVYLPLEGDDVVPATFALPDVNHTGDFRSCRLLRDAVRLGFRNSAGPFRSFGRLNVEPRPYQLVPLLMALRLDTIRLLIADDVGIGKTIEAGLIVRELLDRGEIQRIAVLCPPHLAGQWQSELATKFHIPAELVLTSTVSRLEHSTAVGQSLFELYPYVIVSTDYIKSSRRRDEFVRTCPECVIVDEAHTCAFSAEQRGRHLRHQLLQKLSADQDRHLILVTATPHSGDEGAFRSLLALLKPDLAELPDDLAGRGNAAIRRRVAQYLIQRRRADVRAYMDAETPFPEREDGEATYSLTNEYKKLFDTVLAYARERVRDQSGPQHQRRVRWWSALALLRSLASSPAAAAATLRNRSVTADAESIDEVDELGERSVLDLDDVDAIENMDVAPGGQEGDENTSGRTQRARLLAYARRAEGLMGPKHDAKLRKAMRLVREFIDEGYAPILFCRFIPTAEYVAQELRKALPKNVEVAAVTGKLPPAERELRVKQLGEHKKRVLVATDCLSEGINLQEYFSAVMHYDLSWNPTRHEQREGRVDRYGQPCPKVRTLTYYGLDNQIDGLVLDVLIRKHRTIRTSLGISVPVPGNTRELIQAVMQGLLLRADTDPRQLSLFAADSFINIHTEWDDIAERERRSRTLFAQHGVKVEAVMQEWQAMRDAIGTGVDVERFLSDAIRLEGGSVARRDDHLEYHLPENQALREACGRDDQGRPREEFAARFELPVSDGVLYLNRTHPLVEGLASHVIDTTLDPLAPGRGGRCGVIRTRAVSIRTTLLLIRFRYHIITYRHDGEWPLLAEDCQVIGFEGAPARARWLDRDHVEELLAAEPHANIAPQQATQFLGHVVDDFGTLQKHLRAVADRRGEELLGAHRRVRQAARAGVVRYRINAHEPDVLGIYILLPAG